MGGTNGKRKFHLAACDGVCLPFEMGGLGFEKASRDESCSSLQMI